MCLNYLRNEKKTQLNLFIKKYKNELTINI